MSPPANRASRSSPASIGCLEEEPHAAVSPGEIAVVAGVVDVDARPELVPANSEAEVLPGHVVDRGVVVLQVAVVLLILQCEELEHGIEAPPRIELPDVVHP